MAEANSLSNSTTSIAFFPFAYALYNENLSEYCWYCLDEQKTHRQCTGCHIARFCNKECQLLAWKDHKSECKAIKKTAEVPDIEVRLLGRIVGRHKAISTGKDKDDPNFYKDRTSRRNIMDIWAHTKNIRNDSYAIKKFNSIYDRLVQFYDSKALLPKEEIFELHCRDFINRHAISDKAYLKEIGKGLYCDLCAYDHSCRPNTIYVCNGFTAILKPLHSGVNLLDRSTTFYSYIDLLCAKQARRKLLKDTWYFHCECERCEDNSEHILTSMNCPKCKSNSKSVPLCLFGDQVYKDCETQMITCPECGRTVEQEEVMQALAAMRFIDDVLEKNDFEIMSKTLATEFITDLLQKFECIFPKVNIYYCKMIQALIPFVDPKKTQTLLNLHMEVEECVRICYPHNHPALGFHLRNIGIFSRSLQQLDQSLKYLTEAESIFNFVMPTEHSLAQSTAETRREVEKEFQCKASQESAAPVLTTQPLAETEEVVKPAARFKIQVEQEFLEDTVTESQKLNQKSEEKLAKEESKELGTLIVSLSTILNDRKIKSECKKEEENVPQVFPPSLLLVEKKVDELKIEIQEPESDNTFEKQQEYKKNLSPQHESTGVKKKASLKKFSPRARTPLPPQVSSTKESSEEEEKTETIMNGRFTISEKGNSVEVVSLAIPGLNIGSNVEDKKMLSKKKNSKKN